jgi:hypothetical protein
MMPLRSYAGRRTVEERTRELTEALEHQRATSEVLELISRAPVQVQAVLDNIVERANSLCEGMTTAGYFVEGEQLRIVALHSQIAPDERVAQVGDTLSLERKWPVAAAVLDRRTVSFAGTSDEWDRAYPETGARLRAAGMDSFSGLAVPLVHEGAAVGVLVPQRRDGRGFTPPRSPSWRPSPRRP